MDIAGLIVFAGIYFVAVASPGPAVAMIVARSLARGLSGLPFFIAGFVAGDLVLFGLAATGLAVIAQTFAGLFVAIKYAGAAYLVYLAWKIWRSPVQTVEMSADLPRERGLAAFLSSFLLTLGNPKAIVFFVSIMPFVIDIGQMTPVVFAELALLIVCIIAPTLTAIALAADRARRLFRSPRAVSRINKGTAVMMGGVAVAVATR